MPARFALFLIAALMLTPLLAQDQAFEEWLAEDQADFVAYNEAVTRQYAEFVDHELKAFEAFVKEAGRAWGEQDVWVPEMKSAFPFPLASSTET